jgi:hypothetical protein
MLSWALLGLFILFVIVAFVIIQGTRAALAWREAAARGDVKVIRDIVEDSIKGWSAQKRPKPVPAEVWRGIQSMQVTEVEADFVRVSVAADSEYKMVDGRWIEMRNPLQEGMSVTAKAADMLLYELPHYRPGRIQVDVYTQYRDAAGETRRECVLSTYATREQAVALDWEEAPGEEIVRELGGVFRLSDSGRPLPIEPIEPPRSEAPAGDAATTAGAQP